MTWGPLDPDAAHEAARLDEAIARVAHREAVAPDPEPHACPRGMVLQRSDALVICLECGDAVRPHDGYRVPHTLDGLHRRCPGGY